MTQEYNTGVMLIDMQKYKILSVTDYLLKYSAKIPLDDWHTGDQTLISLALSSIDEIELLKPCYNVILNMTHFSGKEFYTALNIKGNYYTPQEFDVALSNTCILHLIDGIFIRTPWEDINKTEKYTKLWFEYLDNFRKDTRQYFKNKNIFSKIVKILNALLPRKFYIKIISLLTRIKGW